MNARKACRQASVRQLNVSIRSLAMNASSHNSGRSCLEGHNSFSEDESHSFASDVSMIHPSLVASSRDHALKVPGRPVAKVSDCAELIQTALDLVDCNEGDEEEEEDSCEMFMKGNTRPVALSA